MFFNKKEKLKKSNTHLESNTREEIDKPIKRRRSIRNPDIKSSSIGDLTYTKNTKNISVFKSIIMDNNEKKDSKKKLFKLGIVNNIFNKQVNISTQEKDEINDVKFKNEVNSKLQRAQSIVQMMRKSRPNFIAPNLNSKLNRTLSFEKSNLKSEKELNNHLNLQIREKDKVVISNLLKTKMIELTSKGKMNSVFKHLKNRSQYWNVLKIVLKTIKFFTDIKENIKLYGTDREINIFYSYTFMNRSPIKKIINNTVNEKFDDIFLDYNLNKGLNLRSNKTLPYNETGVDYDKEEGIKKKKKVYFHKKFNNIIEKNKELPCILLDTTKTYFQILRSVRGIISYYSNIFIPLFIAFYDNSHFTILTYILILYDLWFLFEFIFRFFYYDRHNYKTKSIQYSTVVKNILKPNILLYFLTIIPFLFIRFFLFSLNSKQYLISKSVAVNYYDIWILLYLYKIIFNIVVYSNAINSSSKFNFFLYIQDLFHIESSIIMICEDMIKLILFNHIFACIFIRIARMYISTDNWIYTFLNEDSSDIKIYISSLYFSATSFYKVGYGDIYPVNNLEIIFVQIWIIISSLFYAITLSKLSLYISNLYNKKQSDNRKINLLEDICKKGNIDNNTSIKIKNEYLAFLESSKSSSKNDIFYNIIVNSNEHSLKDLTNNELFSILKDLPIELKCEIVLFTFEKPISKINFFSSQDKLFIATVFPLLKESNFRCNETIYSLYEIPYDVYFVVKGKIQFTTKSNYVFKLISEGSDFGDIEIFNKIHRISNSKSYLNESKVFSLNKKYIYDIISTQFPTVFNEMMCNSLLRFTKDVEIMKGIEDFYGNKSKLYEKHAFDNIKKLFDEEENVSLNSKNNSINKKEYKKPETYLTQKLNHIKKITFSNLISNNNNSKLEISKELKRKKSAFVDFAKRRKNNFKKRNSDLEAHFQKEKDENSVENRIFKFSSKNTVADNQLKFNMNSLQEELVSRRLSILGNVKVLKRSKSFYTENKRKFSVCNSDKRNRKESFISQSALNINKNNKEIKHLKPKESIINIKKTSKSHSSADSKSECESNNQNTTINNYNTKYVFNINTNKYDLSNNSSRLLLYSYKKHMNKEFKVQSCDEISLNNSDKKRLNKSHFISNFEEVINKENYDISIKIKNIVDVIRRIKKIL